MIKAIENEIGKIKLRKKGEILISTVNKKQQEKIFKISHLDGGKIKVHVPRTIVKLRGVIQKYLWKCLWKR